MSEKMRPFVELVNELPRELQDEVRDFVEFLISKHVKAPREKPHLDWRGDLRELRGKFSSVELQHKITELWSD